MELKITNSLTVSGASREVEQAVRQRLTMANPKWIENDRLGRWNSGTPKQLQFYRKKKAGGLVIPRGFVRQLIGIAARHGETFRIVDCRRELPPVDMPFCGVLKPFQKEAVGVMLKKDFGTLSAATGSGKTVMGLFMAAERGQPTLIVVHTRELLNQWISRIETFLGIPKNEIGVIGNGKISVKPRMTVATVQTLYKCAAEVSKHIGFLIVDECHRAPSRIFTEAVTAFDSKYMLGLSATPFRRDKLSRLIYWYLGDIHHRIDKVGLIRTGDILPVDVIVRETDFNSDIDPVNCYSRMLSVLTEDAARNRLIASDVARQAKSRDGVCLVLSDRKCHCDALQAMLRKSFKVESELLTGDITVAERKDIVERLNAGRIEVLIATGQLIGEGFDCKGLSTLFLATPIRFDGRVLQYLGRVLRPAPGKARARVFDYVDARIDVLHASARARQRIWDGLSGNVADNR